MKTRRVAVREPVFAQRVEGAGRKIRPRRTIDRKFRSIGDRQPLTRTV
ncbi:MAG TPA: hypothetical protein VF407_25060 [Polyangiaceae bacterium]